MVKPLKVLIIDDSENDTILLMRELQRAGFTPEYKRVDTASSLTHALDEQPWEIIISDFVMPQFTGLDALKLIRERGIDIPFILTSGKISDETAVMAMKAGAADYIVKDNLTRLGPAIERELQEVTVRREHEKAAKALQQREDELLVLKKVDQLKDEFVGLISHELRTPITIILGALSTVMTEGNKLTRKEIQHLVSDAYWEAETLSDILSNLLELARVQADRLQITGEPFGIKEIINAVVAKMRLQTLTREFCVDCEDNIIVTGDRIRVQRIIHNLLDNALKYSAAETKIEVNVRTQDNEAEICVRDYGTGITQANLRRLFEPFQRLASDNYKISGTGLGLVVCRRLVEAQGGRIWVESQPGEGSAFYFTLPLALAPQ
ncbi:MAG: ATP-binding protein [Dehalococcoidales bacterium]|nr:ATP-binding protein [Dehalococcoidales bacterium]